jgi:predicted signal transduction protein with EAL and GGDEF domain
VNFSKLFCRSGTILSPPPQTDELAEAQRLGHLEAESFDLTLREAEGKEREARLVRLAVGDETAFEPANRLFGERAGDSWRLQQEIERLAAFQHAVVHSRAWRLIQAARRLVGRRW